MGLGNFEAKLESLIEGTFSRAFRSGVQPVELAKKALREMDGGRQIGPAGTIAPNEFVLVVSTKDYDRLSKFAVELCKEIADGIRNHARDERYHFVGAVTVELAEDIQLRVGSVRVSATIVAGIGGRAGAIVLSDGSRIGLEGQEGVIGRDATCDIVVGDPQVSRHHAKISPEPDGYLITDLTSTNGTFINDQPVKSQVLRDGDVIRMGTAAVTFEAS